MRNIAKEKNYTVKEKHYKFMLIFKYGHLGKKVIMPTIFSIKFMKKCTLNNDIVNQEESIQMIIKLF